MLVDVKSDPSVSEPPPYTSSHPQSQSSASAGPSTPTPTPTSPGSSNRQSQIILPQPPPADARRCNHLTISMVQSEKISGLYIVDPSLEIPESLLVPLADGATVRPNLDLTTKHGKLDVDVWVIPSGPPVEKPLAAEPTKLIFGSKGGSVEVRLHSLGTVPCHVVVNFEQGRPGKFTLPHNFTGKIFLSRTHGSVKPLPYRVVTVSDVGGELKAVVGDLSVIGQEGWRGHTLEVKAPYGAIEIAFADEVAAAKAAAAAKKAAGWGSMFGGFA